VQKQLQLWVLYMEPSKWGPHIRGPHLRVPVTGSPYGDPNIPLTSTVIYRVMSFNFLRGRKILIKQLSSSCQTIALNNCSTNNWIKQHKGVVSPQEGVTINFVRMNEIQQNTIYFIAIYDPLLSQQHPCVSHHIVF
jgi:hypothetical protein